MFSFYQGFVNFGKDRWVLLGLGIPWHIGKAPNALILNWSPPPIGWIKVNSDGLAKGNPAGFTLVVRFSAIIVGIFLVA